MVCTCLHVVLNPLWTVKLEHWNWVVSCGQYLRNYKSNHNERHMFSNTLATDCNNRRVNTLQILKILGQMQPCSCYMFEEAMQSFLIGWAAVKLVLSRVNDLFHPHQLSHSLSSSLSFRRCTAGVCVVAVLDQSWSRCVFAFRTAVIQSFLVRFIKPNHPHLNQQMIFSTMPWVWK